MPIAFVVAAWQRALAQKGLTAGRFYAIYNEEVAVPIDDETVRQRFEAKRDADLADIYIPIKPGTAVSLVDPRSVTAVNRKSTRTQAR